MLGSSVAGLWTLNRADEARIGVIVPTTSSLTRSRFPLRPMEGRCALNAEIVVRVHGREPELWSIGRMADCLSAGTGSTPVSSAKVCGRFVQRLGHWSPNPGTRVRVLHLPPLRAWYSGWCLSQADDASSTLAARSMRKSSSGQDPTSPTSRARVRVPPSAPKFTRRCSQDSKASACKADNRECNSPHRLQSSERVLCWCSSEGRARASEVRDRRSNRRASSAGIAQPEEQAHGKRPTAVRGCVPAPKFAGLAQWQCRELVPLRRVFDSLDQLQTLMAGLAEWLRHRIVAPVTRVRFSHLAPCGRFV